VLRAAAKTVAIPPPPGLYGPVVLAFTAETVPPPPAPHPWLCDILDSVGNICGREFKTKRALLAHQRFSKAGGHSLRTLIHTMTVTNRCIYCSQTFRTRRIAQEHTLQAMLQKRCPPSTIFFHPVIEPSD